MESSFCLGQPILPTDKHNPAFTLYRTTDAQSQVQVHVYYGFELLEVVPDDHDDPMFRCMIARLRNAGIKLKSLVEVFQLDPKTIRSWSEALKSRDPARMQAMLFGKHAARKLNAAIESFVLKRLPELFAEQRKDFRATLQREIATFFDTRLSTETLRILISDVKKKMAQPMAFDEPIDTEEPTEEPTMDPTAEHQESAVKDHADADVLLPQNATVQQPREALEPHPAPPLDPSPKGIVSQVAHIPPDSPKPVITAEDSPPPDKVAPLF